MTWFRWGRGVRLILRSTKIEGHRLGGGGLWLVGCGCGCVCGDVGGQVANVSQG